MATVAELTSAYDNTDATSYVTASISPAANSLLYLFYGTRHGSAAPGMTPSGGGLTWVEVEPVIADGIGAGGAWRAQCGASPGSFTITLTNTGGVTTVGASWAVLEVTGHDSSSPVVQHPNSGTGNTGTTATVTFASLASSGNIQLLYCTHRSNEAQSAEAGWTAGTARNGTSPNHSALATWKIGAADLSATQTWSTSARWQGLGVEIQVTGGAVTGTGSATLAGVSSTGLGAPAPEAVILYGIGNVSASSGTTSLSTFFWPTGYTPTADDFGILSIHQNGSNSAVTISGSTWTLMRRTERSTVHVHHLYKRKLTGSSDMPTSIAFAVSSGCQIFFSVWRNVDTATAEDVANVSNTGTADDGHVGPDIGALATPAAAIVTWCVTDGCSDDQGIFVDDDPTIGGPFAPLDNFESAGKNSKLLATACAYHHQSIPSQTAQTRRHSFSPNDVLQAGNGWIATTVALRPANPTITPVPRDFQGALVQVPLAAVGTSTSPADGLATQLSVQAFDPYGAGGDLWSSGGADGGFWDLGAWGGPGRWRDVTSRTRGLTWTVGADQPAGRPRIGTASIELDNADALVSPWITAGPFTDGTSSWLRTGCLVRIAYTNVTAGVGYGRAIYTGEIEGVDESSQARADAWVVLRLVEPLSRLARYNGTEQAQQGHTEDLFSRVDRLLNDADWSFGVGLGAGHVPAYAAAATFQATTLAGERLAELYLTGDSVGTYIYSKYDGSVIVNNPLDGAASYTFSNSPTGGQLPLVGVTPYADNQRLLTVAIGSRRQALATDTDPDPVQPHAIELGASSLARFGRIDSGNGWPRMDLIVESDATIAAVLADVLAFRANDDQGIASLELDADQAPATLYGALSTLRIFDVVDVRYLHPLLTSFAQTQHSYVEGMTHRVIREGYQLKWTATLALGKFP